MIKIEVNSLGNSIFRDDTCWDTEAKNELIIKVFGVKILHRKREKQWGFKEHQKQGNNNIGFNQNNQK